MEKPCLNPKEIWLDKDAASFCNTWAEGRDKGTHHMALHCLWSGSSLIFPLNCEISVQRTPCYSPCSAWYVVDAQRIFINIAFNVFVIFFNKMSPNVLNLWMTYLRHLRFSYSNCFPMEELWRLVMKISLCTKIFYSRYRDTWLFVGCLLIMLF